MNMRPYVIFLLLTFSCLESFSQDLRYSVCENCWSPDSLGNHRAVMDVMSAGKVARAVIPWRRRDYLPDGKNLLVTDRVGNIISNVMRISIHREEADIIFEPRAGAGQYYLYFMKYWTKGRSNYPVVTFPPYKDTADPKWIESIKGVPPVPTMVLEIQSIDELSSFYPMEVIATNVEMTRLTERNKTAEFLVFPEDRLHPVKMKTDLPQRWIQRGPQDFFAAEVLKGENFSFQLGVFARKKKLENVTVKFSDLKGATDVIPVASISCINTSGINWDGTSFEKKVDIAQANVQPLWCVLTIPESLSTGEYTGSAVVQATGTVARTIAIRLKIAEKSVLNGGVDEPWKQTRLTWLNSQVGANDEVIAPYLPLELKGNSISLLGRKLEVGEMGLPKQITTYFSPEMTKLQAEGKQLLSASFEFSAISKEKGPVQWTNSKKLEFQASPGAVTWTSENISEPLKLETEGRLEFDGFAHFKIKLTALHDVDLEDIGLSMPVEKHFSKYMMGLGHKGGLRPSSFSWTWDVANKNQDGAWIGDINGGIQFSLRAENYSRPLNTNFYLQKPLVLPPSWGNAGKGGVQISEVGNSTSVRAFRGPRSMKEGEPF